MAKKQKASAGEREAPQVFRQFAWNLAGTLAKRPIKRGSRRKAVGA